MFSEKIQNEIITRIAKFVRMKIKDIMEETKYFSIIADEVTDMYFNKEIWLFCLTADLQVNNNAKVA